MTGREGTPHAAGSQGLPSPEALLVGYADTCFLKLVSCTCGGEVHPRNETVKVGGRAWLRWRRCQPGSRGWGWKGHTKRDLAAEDEGVQAPGEAAQRQPGILPQQHRLHRLRGEGPRPPAAPAVPQRPRFLRQPGWGPDIPPPPAAFDCAPVVPRTAERRCSDPPCPADLRQRGPQWPHSVGSSLLSQVQVQLQAGLPRSHKHEPPGETTERQHTKQHGPCVRQHPLLQPHERTGPAAAHYRCRLGPTPRERTDMPCLHIPVVNFISRIVSFWWISIWQPKRQPWWAAVEKVNYRASVMSRVASQVWGLACSRAGE